MKTHLPIRLFQLTLSIGFVLLLSTCSACSPGGTGSLTPTPAAQLPAANTDGAETIFVPGGTYLIGSTSADPAALPHEMPQHEVTLTGFNIYTHEVTNSLYTACVAAGACLPVSSIRADLADYSQGVAHAAYPVVGVDWLMADAYCTWAGGRLPTEAEWEVAARGSDARLYPWGNDPASCLLAGVSGCGKDNLPLPVGSFAAGNSPFGVWDMSGNVWEWVNDWYDANYYASSPAQDPFGPWTGDDKLVRGGGWNSDPEKARSANRMGVEPGLSYKDLGFRCVANAFPVEPDISVPGEIHVRHGGDGTSVEEHGRPEDPTARLRVFYWGVPSPDCRSGGEISFGIQASNGFGATYAVDVDGVPLACTYDSALHYLSCRGVPGPTRTSYEGRSVYEFRVHMLASDGSTLPADPFGLVIRTPVERLASCASGTDPGPRFVHHASAVCSTDGRYLTVDANVPVDFRDLSIGGTTLPVTLPAVGRTVSVRLPDSVPSGAATLHVIAFTLDGVTRLEWDEPLTVPACGSADLYVGSTYACNARGVPTITVSWTPRDALRLTSAVSVATGTPWSACYLNPDGSLSCENPPAGSDGSVGMRIHFIRLATGEPFSGSVAFLPISCPGSLPGAGHLSFNYLTCRSDGAPGLLASLAYTGSARSVAVSATTIAGGADCRPTLLRNYFVCPVPSPLPADLQFCSSEDGGPYVCVPSPFTSAHVPPACGGGSPSSGGWSWEVLCTPSVRVPAGWIEFRAHYPTGYTGLNAFGFGGACSMGVVTPGTISNFCPPDTDFSRPFRFGIGVTSGGSTSWLSEHSFTDAAALAATCPAVTSGPVFGAIAVCSSEGIAGRYDLTFGWRPPEYEVYAIYDQTGAVISSCGICAAGACSCTGVAASPDGLIHVQMDNRTGPTEVITPLTIAPPSCPGSTAGGWSLTGTCSTTSPDTIELTMTFPTTLGIQPVVINPHPGWTCWMPGLGGNIIRCDVPASLRGSGPLTWEFTGPAPEYASIFHTFAEYESVVPTSCGGASGDGWSLRAACSTTAPGTIDMTITAPSSVSLTCAGLASSYGWSYCRDTDPVGHAVLVNFPLSSRGTGPLTISYSDGSGLATHTFSEYETVVPLACGGGSTAGGSLNYGFRCIEGDHPVFELYGRGVTVTAFTINGVAPDASACSGMGTTHATCQVPDSWMHIPSAFHIEGLDGSGVTQVFDESGTAFWCGYGAGTWSFANARCADGGGGFSFNILYPPSLDVFRTISVNAGGTSYECVDRRGSTPYHLECYGTTSYSTGELVVTYTDAGGSHSVTIPGWPAAAPRSCPTPVPPAAPQCSDFTTDIACYSIPSMSCKWTGTSCYHP